MRYQPRWRRPAASWFIPSTTRGGDVNRRFCEFAFDGGPVRVDIGVCEDVKSYAVFPSRLGLKSSFKNGVISVQVDRPCNFGVRLNDYDKTILSVFADAPEDAAKVPRKGDSGVMFVDGWTDATAEDGVITVEPPLREVYIAPGAVLNARLVVKSKGAYVHGRHDERRARISSPSVRRRAARGSGAPRGLSSSTRRRRTGTRGSTGLRSASATPGC